jgi:hypothetical protein
MGSSKEEILNKIDGLITNRAVDTTANHIRFTGKFFFDWNNENINGQTNNDSFVLWQYNRFGGSIFYPVIYGTFTTSDNIGVLKLKTRLNIVGKIFNGLLITMISMATLPNCLIKTDSSYRIDFPEILFSMIMIIGFQTVPFVTNWLAKKNSIKFIKEYLDLN